MLEESKYAFIQNTLCGDGVGETQTLMTDPHKDVILIVLIC